MKQAEKLILDGADIIDVGGESTRPGHVQITSEEEISRVVPIIEKISKNLNTIISIDTYKYDVAEAAIKAGANIINDIWGLQYDNGEMADLVKKYNLPIIVMHNQNDEIYNKDIMLSLIHIYRGWFHTSLLTSVASTGDSPYKSVLTHGFVNDGEGRKMSKSLGNTVSPEDVIKVYGADILRLWCGSVDYSCLLYTSNIE